MSTTRQIRERMERYLSRWYTPETRDGERGIWIGGYWVNLTEMARACQDPDVAAKRTQGRKRSVQAIFTDPQGWT